LIDAAYDKPAVADSVVVGEDLSDVSEYGYGFWLKFMTRHPAPLYNGKNSPWYFVSRLTRNNPYKNAEMGDRVLAVF
jgi:hypothetical protein